MTDDELYDFAQRLLPIELRTCPECKGGGRVRFEPIDIIKDLKIAVELPESGPSVCNCGGSGKLKDNEWEMKKRGYRKWWVASGPIWDQTKPKGLAEWRL